MNRGNRSTAVSRRAAHGRRRGAGPVGPPRPGPGGRRPHSRRRATTRRGRTTGALPELRLDQFPVHRAVRDRLAVLLNDDIAAAHADEDTATERAEIETLLESVLPELADQPRANPRAGRARPAGRPATRSRRWSR